MKNHRLNLNLCLFIIFSLFTTLSWSKTITLYLDPASLPALNQLMDFTKSSDDKTHPRIFGLSRFKIPDSITTQYKNIHFVELKDNRPTEALFTILDQYTENIELDLHLNIAHSVQLMRPILAYRFKHPDRISIQRLNLYDDGSMEYVDLEKEENKDLLAEIKQAEKQLSNYLLTGKIKFDNPTMARYVWQSAFPVKYYFLSTAYFEKAPFLQPLKNYLAGNYQKIDWSAYQQLTPEKQAFYLNLVGFSDEIKQLLDVPQAKFIFTGTTTWEGNTNVREYYAQQQLNLLRHFTQPEGDLFIGDHYKIYFKGHPKGGEINDYILNNAPNITNIPANISFEVLMMTGLLPDKVGGVASSLYFSLPKDKISHIIFTSDKQIKNREDALNHPYVKVMRRLGIIDESQIIFWDSLKQL
ncbi:sialyltransferase [Bisgaard Taxon 45]|uniref:Sialyltransferase n=1 Tax=Bisgaard Taxon 45 TaxID=304289 RepID=A0ABT9KFC4_9PAST|nr:sialyltransferase [Bisgaard Taxon 45]